MKELRLVPCGQCGRTILEIPADWNPPFVRAFQRRMEFLGWGMVGKCPCGAWNEIVLVSSKRVA